MNELNRKGILFISDSSILGPVLHSQGIPLLKFMSGRFDCSILSFEKYNPGKEEKINYEKILNKYTEFISFYRVELQKYSFIPFWINYFFSGFMSAVKIVRGGRIDIIHARSLYPAVISIFIKIFYPRLKLIYDNRGVFIEEQLYLGQWKRNGITERAFRMLERQVINKADHIVVVSEIFKNFLISEYPGINNFSRKVSVINNKTITGQKISSEELNLRKDKNSITCVYSGSSAKWQNIREVFSFARNCLKRINNFSLKILTYETPKFSEELNAYADLKAAAEILSLNSDEVFDKLTTANFGLLLRENNLVNNVSSPLKFGEYLAAGLPVVVSEGVGDTEEIISKYNVGIVIKNKDYDYAIIKLKELLQDPDIYKRCRFAAQKEFNLEDSFEKYGEIYDAVSNNLSDNL